MVGYCPIYSSLDLEAVIDLAIETILISRTTISCLLSDILQKYAQKRL